VDRTGTPQSGTKRGRDRTLFYEGLTGKAELFHSFPFPQSGKEFKRREF